MNSTAPGRTSFIVGATGQVGAQILAMLGPGRAVGTTRQTEGAGLINLDLSSLTDQTQIHAVLSELNVSSVYCVGGMTDVERCEVEPELAIRTNCRGPATIAAAAARFRIPFVYFSTEYIFDGKAGPYGEDSLASPISAYGRSKWMGEQAVRSVHPDALIIRTTVVYGPDPRKKNFLYSLYRYAQARQIMRVADDQISTPTYNRDLARATIALVESGAHGVFHVCGHERLSRFEFARLAARIMGVESSGIVGVPTAELSQMAPRPLNAGLTAAKLRGLNPAPVMRRAEDALREWVGETGLHTPYPPGQTISMS